MMRPFLLPVVLMGLVACQSTPDADPARDTQREFKLADANGDGFIDGDELDDYMAHRFMIAYDKDGEPGVSFAELKAVNPEADLGTFKDRDRDGDGVINFEEMRRAIGMSPTFGRLMESIDTDGDGRASLEEMKAFSARMEEL